MPYWKMSVVTNNREYTIPLGSDESVALRELAEARKNIGMVGTVTIAERLALKAEDIVSVQIAEVARSKDASG